jgi:NMD protein affecting ribosome stability and mRNA decay
MRRTRSKVHPAATQPRRTAKQKPLRPDPYASTAKLPEPARCRKCALVYRRGRWVRGRAPSDAAAVLCPACQRVRDRYPAGLVTLSGAGLRALRAEIEGLIRNVEAREQRTHPLKRVMALRARAGGLEVSTTDAKLARAIGVALRRAHQGTLDYRWSAVENVLRVRWRAPEAATPARRARR